jgi:enoyl-CoA hydratase/carnithine racemase
MSYETIIYEKKNRVARITLNRPDALNAITRTMFTEIGEALGDAEQAIMYLLAENTSDDAQEGPRAFNEKRKPDFKGR